MGSICKLQVLREGTPQDVEEAVKTVINRAALMAVWCWFWPADTSLKEPRCRISMP